MRGSSRSLSFVYGKRRLGSDNFSRRNWTSLEGIARGKCGHFLMWPIDSATTGTGDSAAIRSFIRLIRPDCAAAVKSQTDFVIASCFYTIRYFNNVYLIPFFLFRILTASPCRFLMHTRMRLPASRLSREVALSLGVANLYDDFASGSFVLSA